MNKHDVFFLSGFLLLIIFMIYLYCKNKLIKYIKTNIVIVPLNNFDLDNNNNNNNDNIPIINSHPSVPELPPV